MRHERVVWADQIIEETYQAIKENLHDSRDQIAEEYHDLYAIGLLTFEVLNCDHDRVQEVIVETDRYLEHKEYPDYNDLFFALQRFVRGEG